MSIRQWISQEYLWNLTGGSVEVCTKILDDPSFQAFSDKELGELVRGRLQANRIEKERDDNMSTDLSTELSTGCA